MEKRQKRLRPNDGLIQQRITSPVMRDGGTDLT